MITIGTGVYLTCPTSAYLHHLVFFMRKHHVSFILEIGKVIFVYNLIHTTFFISVSVKIITLFNFFSGVHHKTKLCDPTTAARTIDKNVERYKAFLYPDNLVVEDLKAKKLKLKKGNGGWGDLRDHELCLSF